MTFKSAKAFFEAANGKRVAKKASGVLTIETWPDDRRAIIKSLLDQGCSRSDIVDDEDGLSITSTGQFILKPKMKAYEEGVLTVRSRDYHFLPDGSDTPVYGEMKGSRIEGSDLVKTYENGLEVRLTILEAASTEQEIEPND